MMDISEIKRKLEESIAELKLKDKFLLENDVSERSITHRMALFLTHQFPDYDVDCEYNSNVEAHNNKKYIYVLKEEAKHLDLLGKNSHDKEIYERRIYPDIIVHKRGKNGLKNNLLIIEVKKTSSQNSYGFDNLKLERYTSSEYDNSMQYLYGAFVTLGVNHHFSHSKIEWYKNGEIINL